MKNRVKKLSLLAIAVCAVVACVSMLAACGDGATKKDYSSYTWATYAKEDWDSKTIAYQFYTPETISGPFGMKARILMNLYEDGGALVYQAGLWTSTLDAPYWYDQENYIVVAYFGVWEESDGEILVRCISDEETTNTKVSLTDTWTMTDPTTQSLPNGSLSKVQMKFTTTGDNAFKYVTDNATYYIPLLAASGAPKGIIYKAEETGSDADASIPDGAYLRSGSDITYSTISAWVASYKSGASEFGENNN